jgi:acyl carrier protein
VVAAVVREENASIDEALVVEYVRARAGARKAPRRVYFVERLPRTDNGKLRRSALPELVSQDQLVAARSAVSGAARVGALSPLEGALAGLWSSLLHAVTIGRDDDFFLLGGDSLRGMELLAHVEELFGVDLPIELLFGDAATVAGMARAIEGARSRTEVQKSIARRQEHRAAYLSDTQRRIVVSRHAESGRPHVQPKAGPTD